jgi:uracil-DNA glycosylase family 4
MADRIQLLRDVDRDVVDCFLCPRLVEWRERVGKEKRRSFAHETYWARPVPNFGDLTADRLIVGLAPAAHGANRTGRMFTGDRSGEWLFRALYRAGVANQAKGDSAEDGLQLRGVLISASVHCAPPDNKPLPSEIQNCRRYLERVLAAKEWRAILCLGGLAWTNVLRTLNEKRAAKFGHGATYHTSSGIWLVGCYHPSQQNTFTGKLTEDMLDQAIETFLRVGP